jgi:hypothetical protein
MAATITDLAGGTSTSSSSSYTSAATVTATAADRDWLVVIVGVANSGTLNLSSVTDSAGNTYTERATRQYTPFPGIGGCFGVYTTEVTSDITNGQVTVNLSSSSANKAVQVYRFRPGTGEFASYIEGATFAGSTATSHSVPSISVTDADTIFCFAGISDDSTWTGDSDTTNGSWSTLVTRIAASATPDVNLSSQYKTVTATGNQTWTVTGPSRPGVPGYIILRSDVPSSIEALAGSYAITGTAASVLHGWRVAAAAGSYAVTGTDADLDKGQTLHTDAGSYAVTGTAASLKHGWKVAAAAGSYAVTGTAATVSWSGESKTITAGVGSYAVTGADVTLNIINVLSAGSGSYAITGTDATLNYGKTVAAAAGSYLVTGVNASPEHGWVVAAAAGSYAVTGSTVTLTLSTDKRIAALAGSYVVTGSVALLEHHEDPEVHQGMPLKTYAPRTYSWVDLTPTIDTAIYAQNDALFAVTAITNAAWRVNEPMQLLQVTMCDEDNETAFATRLYFFDSSTASVGAANAAASISDADSRTIVSYVDIVAADMLSVGFAGAKHGVVKPTNCIIKPASGTRTVYVGGIITSASTPTFTNATDIKLRFAFVS